MHWKLYTDGGCIGNGRPDARGAWAFILNGERTLSRAARQDRVLEWPATNNLMEMLAVISGLSVVPVGHSVDLHTDSMVVIHWVNAINKCRLVKGSTLPKAITAELQEMVSRRTVFPHWVKGHAGHPQNTWCDTACSSLLRR